MPEKPAPELLAAALRQSLGGVWGLHELIKPKPVRRTNSDGQVLH
jgi:hypothetical protein